MRRTLLACLLVGVLAMSLALGCSANKTATAPSSGAVLGDMVYREPGMGVYRLRGDESHLAMQLFLVTHTDPVTGVTTNYTVEQATNVLNDDADVFVSERWYQLPAGSQGKRMAQRFDASDTTGFFEEPPTSGDGGATFHCPCDQCVLIDERVCRCSWGCIKRPLYDTP